MQRQVLYPISDSIFLWNNNTEEKVKATNHPKAQVVTVGESGSSTTSETQAVQYPTGEEEEVRLP